jgi:hypothetical protein
MGNLGRNVTNYASGYDDSIIAGANPKWLMAGASVDWSLVPATTAPVTLTSGRLIPTGQQYLRNGQVLTRITGGAATVATLNNTPTGGTFTLSVTNGGTTTTTTALAYNATGATVQTAILLLSNVASGATVTGSASGPYTFAFPSGMGTTSVTANGALLTGAGIQPTVTFATSADGRVNWFGPFDPSATDGRAVLHRGDIGIVERTIVYGGSLGLNEVDDTHIGLIVGGHVWGGVIIQSGTNTHSLAAGPTRAELEAACPGLGLIYR